MNHITTIFQYMVLELITGIIIGLVSKEIIKFNATRDSSMQIFSASEYQSKKYGNNIPKSNFYNIFNLKPKLVVVSYQEDQIIREDFYTFLGSRTSITYKDESEVFPDVFWDLLGTPIYLCTAVLPMFIGFIMGILLSFSQPLEAFFTHLLISGFIWGSVVGLLYPLLYRESE